MNLNVYASPLPFSNKQIKAHAIVGSSVQDIVNLICPAELQKAGLGAVVLIDGHIVFRKYWKSIRPKENTIINVRIVPQGGGGKKSPLASLLSIAVMFAAPYASGALITAMGGTGAFGLATLQAISLGTRVALGAVGFLLSSALAPPPKPSNMGTISNPAESPTQFIEGAQNALNPFGVIPICLGTNRMFPLQAARPFTETQDNDQYVRQLFTYGYGNKMEVSDFKIGETSLSEFTDFEMVHRLEGNLHVATDLYSNDVQQNDYSVLLQEADSWTVRTTAADVDEAIVDVTFPQGLAQFNAKGNRVAVNVKLELQFSPVGENDWSPAGSGFTVFGGYGFTVTPAATSKVDDSYIGFRRDLVVIDQYTGLISSINGNGIATTSATAAAPALPSNKIRLSTVLVKTFRNSATPGSMTTTIESFTDDRQPSLFGTTFEEAGDFLVSVDGLDISVEAGAIALIPFDINASQTEALRRSARIKFPESGTYDIRIRRVTADTESDQILDKVNLTAIKNITYRAPVSLQDISGSVVRIKATDQLNGALDQLNVLATNLIPDYDPANETWTERATSNPASLFRFVLQGPANAKPLLDNRLDLAAIEDWHQHCEQNAYTYNRVIDYETSVDEILRDIAAAGSASPAIVDGKRTIVIDRIKDDIVQLVTPRNSWGYSGEMSYPDLPHAFRVQFRNAIKGYQQDEIIVYDDGYNEENASKFEALELQSCTNSDLAFKTARRHIATARLRPETHTFMMDVENLVALRGDRIKFEHDVPIVGIGDGRISSVIADTTVTAIILDDTIVIADNSSYYVRIRLADGTQLYKALNTVPGETKQLNFLEPFSLDDIPGVGDLCYVVQAGGELDLIITRIDPQDDLTARITAVNYAPEIFDAENSAIPAFESKITTPLEFIRPVPPVLIQEQSDEDVMLMNSDGTFTPRAIFTLRNDNEGDVSTSVKIRVSGTNVFTNANVLEATSDRVVLTGLNDGTNYDIHIRYHRRGSSMLSLPLQLNNYKFIGTSGPPDDVTGFVITVSGSTAILKWNAVDDIDISHYRIKFSNAYSGATWGTAQVLENVVYENRLTVPFQGGTYLIKAVDLAGNESENATLIITYDPGSLQNAIEEISEHPTFPGIKDNTIIDGDGIVLEDALLLEGYYYFAESVDLGGVFTSSVSASILANGTFVNDVFDIEDIFEETDIFGSGGNDIFSETDIFSMDDVFGIGSDAWSVQLQYRTTSEDPVNDNWSVWQEFTAGSIEFWAIEFRVLLQSLAQNVSPKISSLIVTVDMPDRIERGEDLVVPAAGVTINYSPEFRGNPSVVITVQDMDDNDVIEFTSKTSSGFTFKVYNTASATYVERTFDFIASGYGRKTE